MQRQHDLAIRVAVSFDGSPLGLYFLHRRGRLRVNGSLRTLWIGEAPDVTIPCAAPELPAARFPIVRRSRGGPGYVFLCPEALLDGSLRIDGIPATHDSLSALPCFDYPGVVEIELRSGMELTLTLGLLTLRVAACQLPRRLALAPPLCVRPHIPTLFIALFAGAVAALASSVPPPPQPLWGEPDLVPRVSLLPISSGPAGASISFHREAPPVAAARPSGLTGRDRSNGRPAAPATRGTKRKSPSPTVGAAANDSGPSFAEFIGRQSILGEAATDMAQIEGAGDPGAAGMGGIGGALVGTRGGGESSIALEDPSLRPGGGGTSGSSASCHVDFCRGMTRFGQMQPGLRHAAGGPQIVVGDAAVTCSQPRSGRGCSDKELIRRVVRSHVNEVRYCYERALQQKPGLQGRVGIRFVIARDGRVEESEAASSTIADPAVGRCIAAAVRRFTFPTSVTNSGITEVNYPFELQPL